MFIGEGIGDVLESILILKGIKENRIKTFLEVRVQNLLGKRDHNNLETVVESDVKVKQGLNEKRDKQLKEEKKEKELHLKADTLEGKAIHILS